MGITGDWLRTGGKEKFKNVSFVSLGDISKHCYISVSGPNSLWTDSPGLPVLPLCPLPLLISGLCHYTLVHLSASSAYFILPHFKHCEWFMFPWLDHEWYSILDFIITCPDLDLFLFIIFGTCFMYLVFHVFFNSGRDPLLLQILPLCLYFLILICTFRHVKSVFFCSSYFLISFLYFPPFSLSSG